MTLKINYYYINFPYPDSNIINHEDLLAILNLTILVSLDEAYIEYSDKESKFQALESVPECQFGLNGGDLSKVTWFHMSKYVSTMISQVTNKYLHCGRWLYNGEFNEIILHSQGILQNVLKPTSQIGPFIILASGF